VSGRYKERSFYDKFSARQIRNHKWFHSTSLRDFDLLAGRREQETNVKLPQDSCFCVILSIRLWHSSCVFYVFFSPSRTSQVANLHCRRQRSIFLESCTSTRPSNTPPDTSNSSHPSTSSSMFTFFPSTELHPDTKVSHLSCPSNCRSSPLLLHLPHEDRTGHSPSHTDNRSPEKKREGERECSPCILVAFC
jgi:hypothetical protein